MNKRLIFSTLLSLLIQIDFAQGFPPEIKFNAQEHILSTGGNNTNGFYEEDKLETIDLSFEQSNFWQLLNSYDSLGIEIPATLTYKGSSYSDVGVRFKGNTTFNQLIGDKKSFNVTMDFINPGADINGYETFNFNNGFQDESFIREVFYLNAIRNHIPAAKANFIELTLNGEPWGLYPNIQQLNSEFIREWFTSDQGSRWRAIRPDSGIETDSSGGPGGQWGSGLAALNFLGVNQIEYEANYTLQKTSLANPWTDLINTCQVLENTTTANWETSVANTLDVDRALWFLASEILFADEDGYVFKGTMDYLLYFDIETNRMVPLEFDGNSVIDPSNVSWSPFYNENNVNYPLMNKLFQIPELRQRYLAHLRTLVSETFEPNIAAAKIDEYASFIDASVQADPKKIYTYNEFLDEVEDLKSFVSDRYLFLNNHNAFNQESPRITNSSFETNGVLWENPNSMQDVDVKALISHSAGISSALLYYASGLEGNFSKTTMYDDGVHNDGLANDGIYGATIPGYTAGTTVRYYIEAIADDMPRTASYLPPGAEHNIFIYKVNSPLAQNQDVVINELMAKNKTVVADEAGQFDDWIELYNNSSSDVSLDGWHITDNQFNLTKFSLSPETIIPANGYLIIWADEDSDQGNLHANFKLNGKGESLLLFNNMNELVDQIQFEEQLDNVSYARVPNGIGSFSFQDATFQGNNDFVSIEEIIVNNQLSLYPNPSQSKLTIKIEKNKELELEIINALGQKIQSLIVQGQRILDVSTWNPGVYFVKTKDDIKRFLVY